MQQYTVIAMTTVRQRQQQEQLRKTTIQTTIQHVAHLPVVDIDDATAATIATCVHLNSGPAKEGGRGGGGGGMLPNYLPSVGHYKFLIGFWAFGPKKEPLC